VQIGFRRFRVRPEVVDDSQAIQRIIERLVLQNPRGARSLIGWNAARDQLECADFSLMIEKVLVVRFQSCEYRPPQAIRSASRKQNG